MRAPSVMVSSTSMDSVPMVSVSLPMSFQHRALLPGCIHMGLVFLSIAALLVLNTGRVSAETIRMTGMTVDGAVHEVTLDEIDETGTIEEVVYNPYEKGKVRYSGVLLDKLVARFADPSVTTVRMTAIDDYRTVFEKAEWQKFRILFVTRRKGERFGLEKKGPARIVYPDFDAEKEIYQVNLPKWMWMIQEIKFE
ncbi:MAG: hypothetical protein JJ959_03940 [Nisaea sp.]|uniref:hypothetical protein n=1 Tax=Nisaea sp. TaxID=2024842 RepID=UPI001B1BF8ED|nr:hypothetical protein [Nisaea sp.]MBO6559658.1 hypothetical protein [Nisaea sp.]